MYRLTGTQLGKGNKMAESSHCEESYKIKCDSMVVKMTIKLKSVYSIVEINCGIIHLL